MSSPTQRSLKYLRDDGWLAAVVEKWIPQIKRRKDLFGIGDIIAVRNEGECLLVQATSGSNVSSRVKKITEHENTPKIRKAGLMIHVHGWRKLKSGWAAKIVDCS